MEAALGSSIQQPPLAGAQSLTAAPAPVSPTPDLAQHAASGRMATIEHSTLDKLGKQIARDSQLVHQQGLHSALLQRRCSDWGPLDRVQHHAAHRTLKHYRTHGVPVTLADSPWSPMELAAAMRRGPHKSAYEHEQFLRDDMADMVDKGFWMVLPFDSVKDHPALRLSPIGVVPQANRRPRPIVDYTFYGINDATQPNAHMDSMQFGRTLDRIIRKIVTANPRHGRVYLSKTDLADGFYRLFLSPRDALKLGVVFPQGPHEPPLVAIPICLPMGWKNSPPAFCTATETIADVTNRLLLQAHHSPPHPLDAAANTLPPPPPPHLPPDPATAVPIPAHVDPYLARHRRRKLHFIDIYMDDFIGAAQGRRAALLNVRRTLFHTIDSVFRPAQALDPPARKAPISLKKLQQGDASWSTSKEVLGWLLDTCHMTLRLPQRRSDRLYHLLHSEFPPARKRAPVKAWHQLLGELRSMTLALPGSRGLFSLLQDTLRHSRRDSHPHSRVAITANVQLILDDFRELFRDLQLRPTRLYELVPLTPTIHGNHDAAGHGAGGVWFPTPTARARTTTVCTSPHGRKRRRTRLHPVLWRMPFPRDIQDRLVSHSNPHGDLTNSDLEEAGAFLHQDCGAQCFDIRERTSLSRTDNTATLYWQRKGSTSTSKAAAELLRLQAFHQRFHREVRLNDYLPGPLNQAADDASRLQHLSNPDLLAHFNSKFPQTRSWHLWTPPPAMRSLVIGALRNMRQPLESLRVAPSPPTHTGADGPSFAPTWPSTLSYKTLKIPPSSFKSSFTGTAQDKLRLEANLSAHAPLRMPYAALAKRSLQWGPRTRDSRKTASWISVLPANSVTTRNRIRRHTGLNQSQSLSSSSLPTLPPSATMTAP